MKKRYLKFAIVSALCVGMSLTGCGDTTESKDSNTEVVADAGTDSRAETVDEADIQMEGYNHRF